MKTISQHRYKCLVLEWEKKQHSDSNKNVLVFLIDNIFDMFGGRGFQQLMDIPSMWCSSPRSVPLFI